MNVLDRQRHSLSGTPCNTNFNAYEGSVSHRCWHGQPSCLLNQLTHRRSYQKRPSTAAVVPEWMIPTDAGACRLTHCAAAARRRMAYYTWVYYEWEMCVENLTLAIAILKVRFRGLMNCVSLWFEGCLTFEFLNVEAGEWLEHG